MKKVLSLTLAALMLLSAVPMVYAADVDYTAGTAVEYTADSDANRAYTITVPASLAPGASGTVTLSGSWASNETVKVTADANVVLTNSINAADTKTLDVTFLGIEKAGDNTEAKTYTETVSVAAMPADALFGTWSGKFNYNVEFDDGIPDTVMFYNVKYTKSDDGGWLMFKDNGKLWFGGTAIPEGQELNDYTTVGQQVKNVIYPGVFSADGYTFTLVGTAMDGTIYTYTP